MSLNHAQLLLVGSLPVESSERAFREGARCFGDLVDSLPDGETGARAGWVGYERERLLRPHPDIVTVTDTPSPTGLPRHFNETPVFKLAPGTRTLRWDTWPRIDDAIASYQLFRALRDEDVIPAGVRFQVGLPFATSALSAFKEDFASDYPIAYDGFEDLVGREVARLLAEIPAEDLALQWDVCHEVLDNEGIFPFTSQGAWERFTHAVPRLCAPIPDGVLLGYHFCYGTFPEWPMFEAQDMTLIVKMANYAVAESGRRVDWLHLAGPRYLRSADERFFAPLKDLDRQEARVFLGIVLPLDGIPGLAVRYRTAARYLDDFGVAMYCGFGRQPGRDGRETMEDHREAVLSVESL